MRVVDLSHDALPTALKFTGGEGKVTLIAGSLVTVALSEARFAPGAQGNSVTVDTSKAVYTHGAAGDLAIGTEIGFRGLLDTAGVLQAVFVDVEGAPSKNDRDSHPNLRFADLQATVISLVGNTLSVTANPGEGNRNSTATTYTVDISKAEMKAWGTACLVAGQKIRVKGALAGTQMVALVVETPADCMKPTPTPPAPPASSPAPTIAVSGSR